MGHRLRRWLFCYYFGKINREHFKGSSVEVRKVCLLGTPVLIIYYQYTPPSFGLRFAELSTRNRYTE